jgi:hypothetical protein
VIVALVAVAVTTVVQLLTHVSVVTIAVTHFNKVDQVWEQVLLDKAVKPLDQLKHQNKYNQADLTHRQSSDISNGNNSRVSKSS